MQLLKESLQSLLHLFFPHCCLGCSESLRERQQAICAACIDQLPRTLFEGMTDNPIEKIFWGRLVIRAASASYYFTTASLIQHLLHQLKYASEKELGWQLGRLMGEALRQSGRFDPDCLVPLPLFPAKEKKRGYNQATLLCQGMAASMGIPVRTDIVSRAVATSTQTKKNRMERWQNTGGTFLVRDPSPVAGKHLLLVDDVITTGATLEACGSALLTIPGVQLSLAGLCFASR